MLHGLPEGITAFATQLVTTRNFTNIAIANIPALEVRRLGVGCYLTETEIYSA